MTCHDVVSLIQRGVTQKPESKLDSRKGGVFGISFKPLNADHSLFVNTVEPR